MPTTSPTTPLMPGKLFFVSILRFGVAPLLVVAVGAAAAVAEDCSEVVLATISFATALLVLLVDVVKAFDVIEAVDVVEAFDVVEVFVVGELTSTLLAVFKELVVDSIFVFLVYSFTDVVVSSRLCVVLVELAKETTVLFVDATLMVALVLVRLDELVVVLEDGFEDRMVISPPVRIAGASPTSKACVTSSALSCCPMPELPSKPPVYHLEPQVTPSEGPEQAFAAPLAEAVSRGMMVVSVNGAKIAVLPIQRAR